ncbi:hypothetical protein GJV07_02625 [Enterobacteriaceae bacterium RIT711]|nr:hypothetical protein [Enterobacteriaceae bacterium RIT711]
MKKITLTIDGKTVEVTEKNIFNVMDMIMVAGQAMSENKNFSQARGGVAMTFSASSAGNNTPLANTLNKLDKLEESIERYSQGGNSKEIWI